MIFVGLSDSYEQFYQAVRRCWRFGQKREVRAYIVTADTEGAVVKNIRRKEKQAQELFDGLVAKMRIYEEVNMSEKKEMEYQEDVAEGKGWRLLLGDSVKRIKEIADESVGLSIFSPPFPGMYAYTNSAHDIGNSTTIDQMMEHFGYMMPDLLRITMSGRNCCIHLTQIPAFQGKDGYIGIMDFRGRVIMAMEKAGWRFFGEVTIDKNPQVKAVRTKERGLLFKSLATDASVMRMALADYLLQFRKDGNNPVPIRAGISEKYGNSEGWITADEWIEWAAPVWYRQMKDDDEDSILPNYPGRKMTTDGIKETDVLPARVAREEDDEKHLCPLQLGVIERAVKLWSAPGDLVFSPFAGIGSEGYQAIRYGRQFVGIELKRSYFDCAVRNLQEAKNTLRANELFSTEASA
jgi:DNA modification methylase